MPLPTTDPALPLDTIRATFRAHGLAERRSGGSYVYTLADDPRARMLLILQSVGRGAQLYLFPEALRRAGGAAQPFYAALEAAGFGMGSKLGPSISLDVADAAQMTIFWAAFGRLLRDG